MRELRFILLAAAAPASSRSALVSAQAMAAAPNVTKRAVPIPGTEDFTIELRTTGAGDSSTSALPVTAVISLDRSGSMSGTKIQDAVDAAIAFVTELSKGNENKGAIVSWSSKIIPASTSDALTSDFPALIDLTNSTSTGGGTDLDEGLNGAIDLLDTDTANSLKVIVFLTDGQGTYTDAVYGGPASVAAQNGYRIYAIGVGSSVDEDNLEDMANATMGRPYRYPDIPSANLTGIFMDIFTIPRSVNVEEITQDYMFVDCDSTSPTAATCDVDQATGKTTFTWNDIGVFADGDSTLTAAKSVILSFRASATIDDRRVPVNDPDAQVTFEDSVGNVGTVPIPQVFASRDASIGAPTPPPSPRPPLPSRPPTRRK